MTRDELQAFHQDVTGHHQFINEALTPAQEGKPAYDCKGFCALEAQLLVHEHGYTYPQLTCLAVDTRSAVKHMVLQVGDDVLDDCEPLLTKRADYTVLREIPSALNVLMCGMKT